MGCSLSSVVGWILGIIAMLGAAIAAAAVGQGMGGISGAALILVAAGLVGAALLALGSLESAMNAYRACRDPFGTSPCSFPNVSGATGLVTGLRVALGVVASAFLGASLRILAPFIGQYLSAETVTYAIGGIMLAIGLLLALLAAMTSYKSCEDRRAGGTGTTRRPIVPGPGKRTAP